MIALDDKDGRRITGGVGAKLKNTGKGAHGGVLVFER